MAIDNPLTGYEPNLLDNFDYSETSAAVFQDESGDTDTESSYSCDAELDDEIIGKALFSPLFTQEREKTATLRQTYHSHEESLLPAQSFFTHTRTGRLVHELSSCQKRKSGRDMENERIRILLERQKEQILADLITADHKKSVKKVNRVTIIDTPMVVQDLATQRLQSYPCKTKTSQETHKSLMKFLKPTKKPRVIYTDNSLEFGKSCEELSWNHCMYVNATQIRNKWDCRKSSAQSERRDICGIVAIRSGQRVVGAFHGMLLLSEKHSRSYV